MTQEVLKLALEALEEYVNVVVSVNDPNEWTPKVADAGEPARKAITAIKEALRENAMREVQRLGQEIEQEPFAWFRYQQGSRVYYDTKKWDDCQPLYTQSASDYERGFIDGMQKQMQSSVDKAVNAMSQRTWVGLTDEEENEYNYLGPDMHWVIQEIEAKLKEKNNA